MNDEILKECLDAKARLVTLFGDLETYMEFMTKKQEKEMKQGIKKIRGFTGRSGKETGEAWYVGPGICQKYPYLVAMTSSIYSSEGDFLSDNFDYPHVSRYFCEDTRGWSQLKTDNQFRR